MRRLHSLSVGEDAWTAGGAVTALARRDGHAGDCPLGIARGEGDGGTAGTGVDGSDTGVGGRVLCDVRGDVGHVERRGDGREGEQGREELEHEHGGGVGVVGLAWWGSVMPATK
jgi:hypothetical protein